MIDPKELPQIIAAIGALGTAAFGLTDVSKRFIGINNIGFDDIAQTIQSLTPPNQANTLSQDKILATLKANWANGTDLSSQKSIAKSLIKLNLGSSNATQLAAATGVDSVTLATVAGKIEKGTALSSVEGDVYGRFDLIITALLDETYQRSDNLYTNSTRAIATAWALALALAGAVALNGVHWHPRLTFVKALVVGLLATPLAPIAKDLSSALATAVNTMQALKK